MSPDAAAAALLDLPPGAAVAALRDMPPADRARLLESMAPEQVDELADQMSSPAELAEFLLTIPADRRAAVMDELAPKKLRNLLGENKPATVVKGGCKLDPKA